MTDKRLTEELEEYLEDGGFIKKDCWLRPMHLRYNPVDDLFELVTSGHTYNGSRGIYAIERYITLQDIPYVGKWVKCNENGENIE